MKILVACEESQVVTKAFRALGHKAFSCDILPCTGGAPAWHIQSDVSKILNSEWDMVIAFPPCTDLCVSGARWFAAKQADGRQQASINFFLSFVDCAPLVCIENPIGIMSTHYRKPDQIIQPYQFGHLETKATCLWLKGLPPLVSTNVVKAEMLKLPANQRNRIHHMPPSANRSRLRSQTYAGIAQAMAKQWVCACIPGTA